LETVFREAGPRRVGLRVSDGFQFAILYHEIEVAPADEGPVSPSATATAARGQGQPFSARLTGRPLPGGWGSPEKHGAKTLVDVLGKGRLKARVLGPKQGIERFLRAPWRSEVRFGFDRRTKRFTASALALAKVRGGSVCLSIRVTDRTGRLTVLGGTGSGK